MPEGGRRRAWLEVDPGALRRNLRRLSEHLGGDRRLLPMVKADGYGVGAARVVHALRTEEPWGFGVATVDEGRELRAAGWRGRVVIFSPCLPRDAGPLLEGGMEPAVGSVSALAALRRRTEELGGTLDVHLAVDTGMGRFGVPAASPAEWIPEVRRLLRGGPLRLATTFTHYHSADRDEAATGEQWRRLREAVRRMRERDLRPGLVHAGNSAAAARFPPWVGQVVRPGVFLYGADGGAAGGELRAEPVVRLRARVLDVRRVPEGATVSYGATYTAPRPSRLATLGIGYGDGLRRSLSNRGEVLVAGRRAPIRGRVCMDVTVVDVTELPDVERGEPVTLLGPGRGDEEIGLEEMAARAGTIAHEILAGFTSRLPRVDVSRGDGAPSRDVGNDDSGERGLDEHR